MKLIILLGLISLTTLTNAQQVVTIPVPRTTTNSITIGEDQVVELLSMDPPADKALGMRIEVWRGVDLFSEYTQENFTPGDADYVRNRIFSGPVKVSMVNFGNAFGAFTVRISPGQYPPGKTAVIGERDGPMKCTLEESTDLVNWTHSTSGATHTLTNASAKKFFRIKLEQDVGP